MTRVFLSCWTYRCNDRHPMNIYTYLLLSLYPLPHFHITPTTRHHFFLSFTQPSYAIMAVENSPFKRKKGELSPSQRTAILYAHRNGASQTQLALDFGCTRKTIHNTIKRFQNHQTVESLPRSGRPRLFSDRTLHHLFIKARRYPDWTFKQLSACLPGSPSRSLIMKVLKQLGIKNYRSKCKIPIGKDLARRRYRFI